MSWGTQTHEEKGKIIMQDLTNQQFSSDSKLNTNQFYISKDHQLSATSSLFLETLYPPATPPSTQSLPQPSQSL